MENGIGTLSEKSVHAMLKDYLEPDKSKHEVKIGKYIADICNENGIIEIQTKQFKNLVNKLDFYTCNCINTKVVYPLIRTKYINWIDSDSLDVVDIRKSSHTGVIQDVFKELYWIYKYIENSSIELDIILVDANEYKILDGRGSNKKIKATKVDKVPTKVVDVVTFKSISDFSKFIPDTIDDVWTTKDFLKQTKCNKRWLGSGIKILRETGAIELVGKEGNSYLYKRAYGV